MIIFLRPGEQVEVQFLAEGSAQQLASMKPYSDAVIVKHGQDGIAKAGIASEQGQFVEGFAVPLTV
ncbi:hypothetical protein ACWYXJ_29230 [Janthinobacterium lividum]